MVHGTYIHTYVSFAMRVEMVPPKVIMGFAWMPYEYTYHCEYIIRTNPVKHIHKSNHFGS